MPARKYQLFKVKNQSGTAHVPILRWAESNFRHGVYLNSNGCRYDRYGEMDGIFALGEAKSWTGGERNAFDELKVFADSINDWLFGFFSYELKNQLEKLSSKNADEMQMPTAYFFQPVVIIRYLSEAWEIGCLPGHGKMSDPEWVFGQIMDVAPDAVSKPIQLKMQPRVSRKRYLEQVLAIKDHIQAGDIYEMNYCVEFYARQAHIDPVAMYDLLNASSPTPFSCFLRLDDKYLLCASPERFIRKQGEKIISQPIKGTMARGETRAEDEQNKVRLYNDPKERSENVMIVDLVRNDLSRTAVKDSVMVEELFGVYPFRHVHQMISTVVSRLRPDMHYLDVIRCAFPMGSMTGAPKIRAMELIDQHEDTRRGLYSGAVGYISPGKDFDFNVVIRSLLYNREKAYLSYLAGSAITAGSIPEKEYEECLLKAKAVLDLSTGP